MKVLSFSEADEKVVSHNSKIQKHVILENKELGNITQLAQAVFPPGEIAHTHSHTDMVEIFMIQSGEGIIRIDDKPYNLSPNICAVVEPNESHEIVNTGEENLVITFIGLVL